MSRGGRGKTETQPQGSPNAVGTEPNKEMGIAWGMLMSPSGELELTQWSVGHPEDIMNGAEVVGARWEGEDRRRRLVRRLLCNSAGG